MKTLSRLHPEYLAPLLIKELTERAARRRTYSVRTLYMIVVTFIGCFTLWAALQRGNPQRVGGEILDFFSPCR